MRFYFAVPCIISQGTKAAWICSARFSLLYVKLKSQLPLQVCNCMYAHQYSASFAHHLQGHFQIIFNPEVCPLLQSKLSLFWRLMYCQGCWSYIVGGISTPFFIALPIITIWIGVFPIVISRELALAMTIYGVANYMLLYYVRSFKQ